LVAEAVSGLLQQHFDVCGIVHDGIALQKSARQLKPDAVVLAIDLPGLSGLNAGASIKHSLSAMKLIYLTVHKEAFMCAEALRCGASGYVTKDSTFEELITAVNCAIKGDTYITPLITKETVEFILSNPKGHQVGTLLSPREQEVLQLLAQGYTTQEVGTALNIRAGTVAFHKYKAMRALGLRSSAELLRYAFERGQ